MTLAEHGAFCTCDSCQQERSESRERANARQREMAAAEERAEREIDRQERHHEVLCLVLKELVRADCIAGESGGPLVVRDNAEFNVDAARVYADLAYPPPKQEQP